MIRLASLLSVGLSMVLAAVLTAVDSNAGLELLSIMTMSLVVSLVAYGAWRVWFRFLRQTHHRSLYSWQLCSTERDCEQ